MRLIDVFHIELSSNVSSNIKSLTELKNSKIDFSKQKLSEISEEELKIIEDFKIDDFDNIESKILTEDLKLAKYGNLKRFYEAKVDEVKEQKKKEEEVEKTAHKTLAKAIVRAETLREQRRTSVKEGVSTVINPRATKNIPQTTNNLSITKLLPSQIEEIKKKSYYVNDLITFNHRKERVSTLVNSFQQEMLNIKKKRKNILNNISAEDMFSPISKYNDKNSFSLEKLRVDDFEWTKTYQIPINIKCVLKAKSVDKKKDGDDSTESQLRTSSVSNIKPTFVSLINRLQFLIKHFLYEIETINSKNVQNLLLEEKKWCDRLIKKYEKESKSKVPFMKKIVKNIVFKKLWATKIPEIKSRSFFKNFASYKLKPLIMKGGDDLRQEVFAMQLFKKFDQIFKIEQTGLYIRPYEIMVTSSSAGFLEFLNDTTTVSSLKNKFPDMSLSEIYKHIYQEKYEFARKNFIESLAGYSILCYLLQIKDRHNGNIMITHEGYMLHIDFGFLLSNAPGNVRFETAPFKMTQDYVDLLEGENSEYFEYFQFLILKGFLAVNKHLNEIITLIKVTSEKSPLPCFKSFNMLEFKSRFANHLMNEVNFEEKV